MGLYISWLADAARMTGYPVMEVPGWRARGHGPMRAVEGVVFHHTANPQPGVYPSLRIVRDGRADLAGPLAHLGLGRDGTVFVIAAGQCWHAGASAWAGMFDLNDEFVGVEGESAGTRDDWTPEQRDCYPRLMAALLHFMRRGADRAARHAEVCQPAGRKIDAAYWSGPQTRERIAWLLGDPPHRIPRFATPVERIEVDDMAQVPQAEWDDLKKTVNAILDQMKGPKNDGWDSWRVNNKQKLTLVDLARSCDRELNQKLNLTGRPMGDSDTTAGHVVSMRAELRQAAKKWDEYIDRSSR